ncbi:MAG: hypothetical protein QNK92_10625 [Amylibacter sp.]
MAKAKEKCGKTADGAAEHDPEMPMAQMAKGGSLFSRFNTPVMSVIAGIVVSGFGFFVTTAVIA